MSDVPADAENPTVVRLELKSFKLRELVATTDNDAVSPPVHVKSATQMRAFAEHVTSSPKGSSFGLLTDPGLGKTTQFPLLLAETARAVVILVEYCSSLADCSADGLIRAQTELGVGTAVPVVRYRSGTNSVNLSSLSGPYIVVTSARVLLSRIIDGRIFPEAIVLHDESHYCDYATYTWRRVSPHFQWITHRVAMSATLTPTIQSDKTVVDGVQHDRRDKAISIPPVKEWVSDVLPASSNRPWTIGCLRGRNTLVFSDDQPANRLYARKLTDNGFRTHVLAAVEAPEVVKRARDDSYRSCANVVIFGSSLYRNGYNFGVDVVIDCGMVREQYIENQQVLERYRRANQTEILQAAARVGRSRNGVAFRPTGTFTTTVPMLALGEVRHAAALHILAGFKPSPVLVELANEVATWTQERALTVVRSSLHMLVQDTVGTVDVSVAVDRLQHVSLEKIPRTTSTVEQPAKRENVSLQSILSQARDFDMQNRHVDDVFVSSHPGTRYEVPAEYFSAPTPYWVGPDDVQRMLRKLLHGGGRYDVQMLSEPEMQWFVVQLVTEWNDVASRIISNSILLTATQNVTQGACIHPEVVSRVQTVQRETAFHVRELEALMELMRVLYTSRPYAVRVVDADNGIRESQIRSVHGKVAEVARMPLKGALHDYRVPVERLISDSKVRGPTPYSWHTSGSANKQRLLAGARIAGAPTDSSGSN